jgi:hypothetical protein
VKQIGSSWFLYDDHHRLVEGAISTTTDGGGLMSVGYGYDNLGNLQSITHEGLTRFTPTTTATNQLTAGGVGYDSRGNVDEINSYQLTIDPFNQPIEAEGRGRTVVYLYTVDNERVLSYDLTAGVSERATRDLDRPGSARVPRHRRQQLGPYRLYLRFGQGACRGGSRG